MDRSVDSIGSCSLDVDADSTDFSDTSGSLNITTPTSAGDITKEFTSRIKERCQISQIRCQQTTSILDPISGKISTVITDYETPESTPAKKPSYLNLACCVSGYSNLTTYDSTFRQNINKSREVSPIRPSTNALQYYKTSGNFLAPPQAPISMNTKKFLSKDIIMDNNIPINQDQQQQGIDHVDNVATNGQYFKTTKFISTKIQTMEETTTQSIETKSGKSFIEQRVERLYGPGALAQGFYSPKKSKIFENSFLQRSPNTPDKYSNSVIQKDINSNKFSSPEDNICTSLNEDLPVLRHLRPEFRAQLPILSPKRTHIRSPPDVSPQQLNGTASNNKISDDKSIVVDVIKRTVDNVVGHANNIDNGVAAVSEAVKCVADLKISKNDNESQIISSAAGDPIKKTEVVVKITVPDKLNDDDDDVVVKDGHYFLKLLKSEQNRLLEQASHIENELELLTTENVDVPEEIFGYLRSAAGKSRLLVSQKMKQFEGLCQNNLNRSPDEKFPTTNEDLQGFWDMVNLQIGHVDSLFAEMKVLKSNGWKKPVVEDIPAPPTGAKLVRRIVTKPMATAASKGAAISNGASLKKSTTASQLAQKREAQRKQLLEMKRKNKMAMLAEQDQPNIKPVPVEIFVNDQHCS